MGGHRGHYFWPSFVFTEFRFALMFPFSPISQGRFYIRARDISDISELENILPMEDPLGQIKFSYFYFQDGV